MTIPEKMAPGNYKIQMIFRTHGIYQLHMYICYALVSKKIWSEYVNKIPWFLHYIYNKGSEI